MKDLNNYLCGECLYLFNDDDMVECFYSSHIDKFCIMMNAKMIFSSKHFNSFKKKIESLKIKYNLRYQK